MNRSEIPSLDDLRAFEAVARLGSVRAAALELSLTHGAVSRRVAKLARDLDLAVLEAHGRGVRLTPQGETLADAANRGFGVIVAVLRQIKSASESFPIILSCERSLAMRWLIPRLSEFHDRYPHIDVHLSTGGGALDFARDRVTLAIRRLDFPVPSDWTITKLMPECMGPVMLPSQSARFAEGNYLALGSKTRPNAWAAWLDAHPEAPRPQKTQMLDHHFLMAEGALGGLGVALAPQAIVAADVANGRLAAPFGFDPDGTDYGLIVSSTTTMTEDVAALRNWLLAQPI